MNHTSRAFPYEDPTGLRRARHLVLRILCLAVLAAGAFALPSTASANMSDYVASVSADSGCSLVGFFPYAADAADVVDGGPTAPLSGSDAVVPSAGPDGTSGALKLTGDGGEQWSTLSPLDNDFEIDDGQPPQPFSFRAWVDWDGSGSWPAIFDASIGQTGASTLFALSGTSGKPALVECWDQTACDGSGGTGAQAEITSSVALTPGWHYLVVTEDSSNNATIYVDGQVTASGFIAHNAPGSYGLGGEADATFTVGRGLTAGSGFSGELAGVAVSGDVVSPSQVESEYSAVTNKALAYRFMPELYFDSGEKWRPLNIDDFLSEKDPSTGQPWNQMCSPELGCTGLTSSAGLLAYTTPDSYISIHRDSASSPDSYESPDTACYQTNHFGVTLHDCDTGPASAIYYHVVGPSPGGYSYFDYWIFYRYNEAYLDRGNHAGDWEGITVAPTNDDKGLAYVELSQHGTWYSYLPGGLTCGIGNYCATASNGEQGGLHVSSFPAAGSHANYPAPGENDGHDGSNNGDSHWGNNLMAGALLPLPAPAGENVPWTGGPENWTDWPGAWGDTPQTNVPAESGSPCGPAATSGYAADGYCGDDHGGHYYAPWSSTGTALSCSGDACPEARSRTRSPGLLSCGSWFGSGVAIAACAEAPMQHALQTRHLSRRGRFAIELLKPRRWAPTAPGVAQLLAAPLTLGDEALLRGSVPAATELLVRARAGRRRVTATFDQVGPFRGRAIVRVRHKATRGAIVVLKVRGKWIQPTSIATTTVRRRRTRYRVG